MSPRHLTRPHRGASAGSGGSRRRYVGAPRRQPARIRALAIRQASTRAALVTRLAVLAVLAFAVGTIAILIAPRVAAAQGSPLSFNTVQGVGEEMPKVRFTTVSSLSWLEVKLKRKGGETYEISRQNIPAGETLEITVDQPHGVYDYQMKMKAQTRNGDDMSGTQTIQLHRIGGMKIMIDYGRTDIDAGKLAFQTDRPIVRAELDVYGEGKSTIDNVEKSMKPTRKASMQWETGELPVLWELKVWDKSKTWASIQVFRFNVPHDDVVFDTNKANIRDDQEPKLHEPLEAIQDAIETYDTVQIQLYVAGYTDTVGSDSANLKLSRKRAKSIAKWFRSQGLDIPIFYNGFGEKVLAVQTGDNVDAEANRRAVYLLTNSRPGRSPNFPNDNWKRLR